MASVDAEAALIRAVHAVSRRDAGTHQERAQPEASAQLAECHLEQCDVSAVPVVEDEGCGGGCGNRASDVHHRLHERVPVEPYRSGGPVVLVRLGVRERRKQPDILPGGCCGLNDRAPEEVCHQKVSGERQVRSVVFDCPGRQHQDRVGRERGRRGRSRQVDQVAAAGAHETFAPVDTVGVMSLPGFSRRCGSVVAARAAVRSGSKSTNHWCGLW